MECYANPALNRATWGRGPWDREPDKLSWTDEATELPCLIVRRELGALCGYVAVGPDHPLHGRDYDDPDVSVHGGLTYSAGCREDEPIERAVCHVPEPGQPADVWWFGFDMAHAYDAVPAMGALYRELGVGYPSWISCPDTTYKTVEYVMHQCAQLAQQLHAMGA